jgi:hypothetical protein
MHIFETSDGIMLDLSRILYIFPYEYGVKVVFGASFYIKLIDRDDIFNLKEAWRNSQPKGDSDILSSIKT